MFDFILRSNWAQICRDLFWSSNGDIGEIFLSEENETEVFIYQVFIKKQSSAFISYGFLFAGTKLLLEGRMIPDWKSFLQESKQKESKPRRPKACVPAADMLWWRDYEQMFEHGLLHHHFWRKVEGRWPAVNIKITIILEIPSFSPRAVSEGMM